MINGDFKVQGGMKSEQYFDETPNKEGRRLYDHIEESSCPLCEGSPHSALSIVVILMDMITYKSLVILYVKGI